MKVVRNKFNKRPLSGRNQYLETLPKKIPESLFSIAVGVMLGDATMYASSKRAHIKLEQGYRNEEYVKHLLGVFGMWSWYLSPSVTIRKDGKRAGLPGSYHFYTIKLPIWLPLYQMFYKPTTGTKKVKIYTAGTITKYLCGIGLAHWIFDDGSLDRKGYMKIHTENFTKSEVEQMCKELNAKFGLSCTPMRKRLETRVAWTIYIPKRNMPIIKPFLACRPKCMQHKIPAS